MSGRVTRLTGMGTAAAAALALLVLGLVLAAAAGPRAALASRTTALRQTLSGSSPLDQTILASTTWDSAVGAMQLADNGAVSRGLTAAQLSEISRQLRADFGGGVLRFAPPDEDWAGLTSSLHSVDTALPATDGVPVRLEVTCRLPLLSHLRLVAGGLPAAAGFPIAGGASATRPLQVVVSQPTAAQFALRPGSRLAITGPQLAATGAPSVIAMDVTGIVAPRDPTSAFWQTDPVVLKPELESPAHGTPFWVAGVFAGAGEIGAVQNSLGSGGMTMQWQLPLDFGSLSGQQAQAYYDALNRLATQTPTLTGDVAPVGSTLQVAPGPVQTLAAYLGTTLSVDVLLWLLYASLAVAAVVMLLLVARMIAAGRSAELTMRRARGASVARIAATTASGVALVCGPAAVVGVVLAVLLVPGQEPAGGWWLPAGTLAVVVAAPAALAAWQHRLPRRGVLVGGRSRARVRLAAELTAVAAAVAGITVFRQQGTAPGAGVNLYTSAAPVLVTIPAVIVVLRLYPVALRGLLRGYRRCRGAVAYLGLTRAARAALTPALPAFALVLALGVAAFAGTVRNAITAGQVAASWRAAGADVTISAVVSSTAVANTGGGFSSGGISPAAQRAAAAVPGVTHAAGVWEASWTTPGDQLLTVIAVDPAAYADLVAATPTFPPVPAASLEPGPRSGRSQNGQSQRGLARDGLAQPGLAQPVLASPPAAAELGRGSQLIRTRAPVEPVRVRVAGELSATPALPAGGAFVLMPLAALRPRPGTGLSLDVTELLLTGPGIDRTRLTSVTQTMMPGAVTTFRSEIFNALADAPLQHGAVVLFTLGLIAAAVLGSAVMLLGVALGAADREAMLARLAAMGLGERQRAWVVVWEVLPGVVAAALAALACALALPWMLGPAIDLTVFTGDSSVAAPLSPSVTAVLLPLAGLIVVALAVLFAEVRRDRRAVARSLRADE